MAVKETQISKLVGSDVHLVRFDGREFTGELTRGSRVTDDGEQEFVIQVGTRGRPPFFFASEVESIAVASAQEVTKARRAREVAREATPTPSRSTRNAKPPTPAEVRRAFEAADKAMANLAALVERVTV